MHCVFAQSKKLKLNVIFQLKDSIFYYFCRGVSYEKALLNLFKVFTDPKNLILVLNSDEYEEKYFTKLLDSLHVRQASTNSTEREKVYLEGGLQFISTQVLVLDLLKNKIPAELITGVFVLRAHQIIESCQEAFALRLFRQKNKTGFVKAFSNSAEAFTYGFGHVERVMRNLFIKDLFLWPRFHSTIQKNLKKFEPISVEFHIPLSPKLAQIQSKILELMIFMVKELKRINPTVDLDEVTVENCVTKKFQKILQSQLDVIWHQLNSKTKLIIADLKILRNLMFTAIYSDSVTFYSALRKYRTAEYAKSNSGWTLLDAAERIFKLSKERVFNNQDEFDPEASEKWKAISTILCTEIPVDIKNLIKDESNEFDKNKPIRILILCNDARSCYQLNQYLTQGYERTLFWTAMKNDVTVQKLSRKYKFMSGAGSGVVNDAVQVNKVKLNLTQQPTTTTSKCDNEKFEKLSLKLSESRKRKTEGEKEKEDNKNDQTEDLDDLRDSYLLTMSQRTDNDNESFSAADFDITKLDDVAFEVCPDFNDVTDLNATTILSTMQKPAVFIQTFQSDKNRMSSLGQKLNEMQPDYVILYNINITAIRQIEMFEARFQRHVKRRLKVFVLMHTKTVEEQSFLTSLRREKQAFELLIETKRVMIIPQYQDGKTDIMDELDEIEEQEAAPSTRQAGGQVQVSKVKREKPKIIVDSREFRSELPCLIHKRGLEVVPAMISIGDYILTPEICVERKSISDLIGSLNCGRLYNQCQQMSRFYSRSILLIEFDQNRPFHFQGRYMVSRDSDSDSLNASIMQKLQLLTIHFPKLRLVWSPSPYATAQLFEELKLNKEEPNLEAVLQVGNDDDLQELTAVTDKFNTNVYDFLLKLPGISSKNIHHVMSKGGDLKNLVKLSEPELIPILGNSVNARLFYDILHNVHKPSAAGKQENQKFGKSKKFFKRN